MGLGKSIKRLLPAALAAALGIGIIWYGQSVRPSPKPEVRVQVKEKLHTWLLTGTGATLAALLAAYGIRRLKGKKEALLQSAVENPYTAGAVTAISYGATAYTQIYDPLFSAVCGLVPAAGVFTVSRALKEVNPPYWKNYPSQISDSLIINFSSDEKKKENALKRMRLYSSDPDRVDLELVDFLFGHNRIDEALEYLNTAVKASQIPQQKTLLEQHFVNPLAHEHIMGMRSKHPFLKFYSHFRMGEVDEALEALDDFVGDDQSPSKSAARAYVFQNLSEHEPQLKLDEHVNRAWQDTIQKVLADPEREKLFKPMGESRNEVMEYEANEFLKGLLVFKRCDIKDRERLIRERENILAFRKLYGNEIIESLAYVEHEGKAYHVLRHEAGKTLDDILKGTLGYERATTSWTDSARLLARIHKADMPWESPEISEDYYSKRLSTVCYDQLAASAPKIKVSQELRAELEQVGMRVYTGLKDAPLGWYKDANWRNWLRNEIQISGYSSPNLDVIAIDFEHRIRLPVQLDLVSLRESGYAPEEVKDLVLNNYFVTFGKPKNRDRFMHQYDWAGLQRHLEFAGYRARDKEYEAIKFHISQARHYAMEVGETSLAAMLGKSEHISIT